MKDIKIDGSDKTFPDAAAAIEALRKARKWKAIYTSATFKISETADEITDAVCCYETAEELANHTVARTPEMFGVNPETGDAFDKKTGVPFKIIPATTIVTDAPRVTWTAPRAK